MSKVDTTSHHHPHPRLQGTATGAPGYPVSHQPERGAREYILTNACCQPHAFQTCKQPAQGCGAEGRRC